MDSALDYNRNIFMASDSIYTLKLKLNCVVEKWNCIKHIKFRFSIQNHFICFIFLFEILRAGWKVIAIAEHINLFQSCESFDLFSLFSSLVISLLFSFLFFFFVFWNFDIVRWIPCWYPLHVDTKNCIVKFI